MPRKRTMVPRVCEWCGADFLARKDGLPRGKGRYCSQSCRGLAHRLPSIAARPCAVCGTMFTPQRTQDRMGRGRYCTRHCWATERRVAWPRPCATCGHVFTPKARTPGATPSSWCSRACSAARNGTHEQRFWAKVDKSGSIPEHLPELGRCWLWTASRQRTGYGQTTRVDGSSVLAHRLSYESHHAVRLTRAECVLHHCDNPRCVRPDHLFLGTHADNVRDMIAKGRDYNSRVKRMLAEHQASLAERRGSMSSDLPSHP